MTQRPLLRRGGLSGRVYVVTRWHTEDGVVVADEKHDVTDEYDALRREDEAGWVVDKEER